ncbi:uncharacterized protein LACBIDRAFT_325943 [Laccaria bicolor S238N-H82]|uniref:Predicted protein n=1 Tax=Laccaria bicolor (strain S238N-H82 / ATCC MYA-4686) TaxID=486041 RepID=B0D6S0_LACBS|nr:uncharacterized protein LACBIDRAFT_325943 [Laccaria bicolor S238N-H82]EDR09525.1 predicted protein [Laccaria bicolor S238N-H82]|eukprot:XP_001879874.1 predicted protein [Laccaria bicolor S238N-H82]
MAEQYFFDPGRCCNGYDYRMTPSPPYSRVSSSRLDHTHNRDIVRRRSYYIFLWHSEEEEASVATRVVPTKVDTVGSNDSLVGLAVTMEEELSRGRSEGSRPRKPLRGAPPSSLSQPTYSDCSRSSSPSKFNRASSNTTPWLRSPAPTRAKNLPISSTPRIPTTERKPLANYYKARDEQQDVATLLRRRQPLGGHAVTFQHHRFLPRNTANAPSSSPSFQPQFPSSETHHTPSSTFHPETSNGFKGSPMARLILQYKESSDEDISTHQRAVNLSVKKSLLMSEIVESKGSQRSYTLHPTLLKDITQVVGELQIFLERTSALIPERKSYYKVDPRDTFLSILRESSDAGQLQAAWMAGVCAGEFMEI